jgi:hypothetical protein
MTGLIVAFAVIFVGGLALIMVWHRWHHQVGGRTYASFKRTDGGMTLNPTGYPEEMKGHAKVIPPVDANTKDVSATDV